MVDEVDFYSDENVPLYEEVGTIYAIKFPKQAEQRWNTTYYLYVEVETYGMLTVQGHSYFRGKQYKNMDYEEKTEVYAFLTEWEFAQWMPIGPEDRELFGGEKLGYGRDFYDALRGY